MTTATPKPRTRTPTHKKLKCASPATAATPGGTQLKVTQGSKVEVKIDEEGFRGAWYSATVVEVSPPSKRGRKAEVVKPPARYLVQYDTLLAREGNSHEPLREFADVSSIRPAPPADEEEKRVFRLYDVVDAFHRDGWWTGVVTRVSGKKGGSKFTVYFQNPPEEKVFTRSNLRLHRDWVDGKWNLWQSGAGIEVGKQQNAVLGENKEQTLVETKTMSPKSGVEIADASVPDKEVNASTNATKEDGQLQCTSIVIGLKSKKTRGVHTPNGKEKLAVKLLDGKEKRLNDAELLQPSKQEIAEPESVVSSQKRKRGRPAKSKVNGHTGSNNLVIETNENGAETALTEVPVIYSPEIEGVDLTETVIVSQGRKKLKRRPGGLRKRTSKLGRINKQSNLTAALKSSSGLKTYASKKQIPRSMSDTEPLSPDTEDALREKTSRLTEVPISETLSQSSDDVPLLMWFGGMKSGTPMHDSGTPISVDKAIKPCTYINGRREENATEPLAIASEESGKDENLPFTKCFPVWTTLESMEVFQQMPQKPHFKPLSEAKESNREGLAIAHMVTFANIAKAASKLQIDDLKITIESNLETLCDLEVQGFKVDPIRDRLNQFLLKKDEKGRLVERLQKVRAEREERTRESSRIDEEVQELDRKIEELRAKLSSAKSASVKIDTDIAALELENGVNSHDVQCARREFEKFAAAPW